jgi:hypothetical protein
MDPVLLGLLPQQAIGFQLSLQARFLFFKNSTPMFKAGQVTLFLFTPMFKAGQVTLFLFTPMFKAGQVTNFLFIFLLH